MPKALRPRDRRWAAALIPPPPWHYAEDVLAVDFLGRPGFAAATLPEGMDSSSAQFAPACSRLAVHAQNDEYSILPLINVASFIFLSHARWEGGIAWCPYALCETMLRW